VLTYGRDLLAHSVRTAVIVDAVFVVVFAILLVGPGTAGEPGGR
jgi:hypothetical protein